MIHSVSISLRSPWVWLRRIRHRCGYGVQSPYVFEFVTNVLYCPGRYYADARLESVYFSTRAARMGRHRQLSVCRLLFRLTNRWQPRRVCAQGLTEAQRAYAEAGCRQAAWGGADAANCLLVSGEADPALLERLSPGAMVVILGLHARHPFWQAVIHHPRVRLTFDLHDVGIALMVEDKQREHFVLNW